MSVFDLDARGQADLADTARLSPVLLGDSPTPAFTGMAKGIGTGVMRGGVRVAQLAAMAGGGILSMLERDPSLGPRAIGMYAPGELTDSYFRAVDEYVNNAVDYWTPSQAEVGKAGQILGGLSEIALPLAAAGGNPALLVASQEIGQATDLARQGVDAGTAVKAGLIQGAASAVGFKLPFLGKALSTRIASGALGNLAVGAGAAAAEKGVLETGGYKELAAQYSPGDVEARAIDVLTGAAFGGLAHLAMRPSDRDAVATAANAKHFQNDTAPGHPGDVGASVAHQQALEAAIEQTLRGEPVSASAAVTQANFIPRERNASVAGRAAGAQDAGVTPEPDTRLNIPAAEQLSPADRAVETRFRSQIAGNVDAAIAEYSRLPEAQGGRVLNTDLARELSADYRADRTRSAAVHEPASALVKEMYARALSQAPAEGQRPQVVFTGGGTGAGKSTAIAALSETSEALRRAQIVYDTNLNNPVSAMQKIDQALAAGKSVRVMHVARDAVQSLTAGALPRAMKKGRTVPLIEHARTHVGSAETIRMLTEHYANDPRVDIQVIDNTGAKGKVTLGKIDQIVPQEYTGLVGKLHEALQKEHAAGRISDAVFQGTLADYRPDPRLQVGEGVSRGGPEAGAGNGGQPEQASTGRPLSAAVTAAEQAVAHTDFQIPTGDIGADGHPVTRSARELLAEADADIARAQNDAKGFHAAVACFLGRG